MAKDTDTRCGKVLAIVGNLVTVQVDIPIMNREICYIVICDSLSSEKRLMSEVIKVHAGLVYIQVFESTRGVKIGSSVEFANKMLEVDLAPGLLSKILDGLQNDLTLFPGIFLERGLYNTPIDFEAEYEFHPRMKVGDRVVAGDWLGHVRENWFDHQIMVPFKCAHNTYKIKSINGNGVYKIKDTIAVIVDEKSAEEIKVSMHQKWPVYFPIESYQEKLRLFKQLDTGVRVIDTLNPIVEGGTGFIPGPFGCGKTVLQHIISQYASADLIVVAACGERANEVIELFVEFPHLDDPRTGRKLMERTIIICNTSNMPVSAREASVYTAMTISEYYRQMGLRVLLLADSTSRWAQALREMANKMEELPGPDAFPMDLTAIISSFYARAGYVHLNKNNNSTPGSVTFIGTVSPAGGNLKEPVVEATKKAARCFYALSQKRADSKRYPAIDPVDSYSKYLEYSEVQNYMSKHISSDWVASVYKAKDLLLRGREAFEQINILGDDSVPLAYHERYWKAEVIDFCFLQQDAFDKVDCYSPIERQKFMFELILKIADYNFDFNSFEEIQDYFKNIINIIKQMNYCEFNSQKFSEYQNKLNTLISTKISTKISSSSIQMEAR
ncbi:MAG: V-type ATP synthase subunit A [Oligoflexia bacterium]|nr:V-type ATP synthase subunit A [Oligoflexia bacterium]